MKRIFTFLAIIFMLVTFALPTNVYAKTYAVDGTDMTVTVDDTYWYVFTRDNLEDNPELDELGLTKEYMNDFFTESDVYLDALLLLDEEGNYIELFVVKTVDDTTIVNMSNYENDEILKWGEKIADEKNLGTVSLYETQYKFINFEYKDTLEIYDSSETYDSFIHEYYTVINQEQYSIQFQSSSPLTSWEEEELEGIINSIRFNIDESLKDTSGINWAIIIKAAIRGGIIGGGASGMALLFKKKKNKDENEDNQINIIE